VPDVEYTPHENTFLHSPQARKPRRHFHFGLDFLALKELMKMFPINYYYFITKFEKIDKKISFVFIYLEGICFTSDQ